MGRAGNSNPGLPGTAGGDRHSVFIDGEGRLSSCGSAATEGEEEEEEEDDEALPGLLGHGEGVTRLNTPTRLPLDDTLARSGRRWWRLGQKRPSPLSE